MTGLMRIAETFKQLAAQGRAAFMPFLAAGDPDLDTTGELILAMQCAGADLIELGVPYSDPLADGPVIQDAFTRALARGCRVADVLACIRRARSAGATLPVLTMISYSIVYRYGCERYVREFAEAGGDGLIVPDLAVEESDELARLCADAGLALVFLVTPATPAPRERLILDHTTGFLYCVAVVGITGERDELPDTLAAQVRRLQINGVGSSFRGLKGDESENYSRPRLPVCVGFGVSGPDQAERVAALADGVIVGSALVRVISQAPAGQAVQRASELAATLARAVHGQAARPERS